MVFSIKAEPTVMALAAAMLTNELIDMINGHAGKCEVFIFDDEEEEDEDDCNDDCGHCIRQCGIDF